MLNNENIDLYKIIYNKLIPSFWFKINVKDIKVDTKFGSRQKY